jgi:hypothetical protein
MRTGSAPDPPHSAQSNVYLYAGRSQHSDQSIDTEELNLPSDQVTDSRLRDPKQQRGIALSEAIPPNHIAHCIHQFGADPQMLVCVLR